MKYKLVYLEWEDAIQADRTWHIEEEMDTWSEEQNHIISQCGFIFKETKKYIILGGAFKSEDKYSVEQFGHLMKIPTTWIRRRINLTKYI